MKIAKLSVNMSLGIITEILYAAAIMLAAFGICFLFFTFAAKDRPLGMPPGSASDTALHFKK